jgi:hypothetical protein
MLGQILGRQMLCDCRVVAINFWASMRYLVLTSVLYLRFHSLTSRRSGRIKDLGYNC